MNLQNAQENQVFWLKDGRKIRNLHELVRELHRADEETFRYHVNEQKNDFANWVKDVLKDDILATRIRNVKDKAAMERFVGTRIHELRTAEQPAVINPVKPAVKPIAAPVIKAKPAAKPIVKPAKPIIAPVQPVVKAPTIVNAGPTTKMKIVPHIVKTGPTTKLNVAMPRTIVNAGKTTPLHVIARHELAKAQTAIKRVMHSSKNYASTLAGYVLLGIVMGVAIMIASLVLL